MFDSITPLLPPEEWARRRKGWLIISAILIAAACGAYLIQGASAGEAGYRPVHGYCLFSEKEARDIALLSSDPPKFEAALDLLARQGECENWLRHPRQYPLAELTYIGRFGDRLPAGSGASLYRAEIPADAHSEPKQYTIYLFELHERAR